MSIDDGGAAFPRPYSEIEYGNGNVDRYYAEEGMSLRDYFAAKVIQGIISLNYKVSDVDTWSILAYRYADAMIKAKNK